MNAVHLERKKTKPISIIMGETETFMNNTTGKDDNNELQIAAILNTAHVIREVRM
jgi:hypothetical protein